VQNKTNNMEQIQIHTPVITFLGRGKNLRHKTEQ